MGFFDLFSKKKDTLENCLSTLLMIQENIEKEILDEFSTIWQGENSSLVYEVRILSLWIVTISIKSKFIRDNFHTTFCDKIGFSKDEIDLFYGELTKRYNNYFTAFNLGQDGSSTGTMILGSTIFDTVINQNKNLSLDRGDLPITGLTQASTGTSIFFSAFNSCLNSILDQGIANTIKKYQ